MTINLDEYEYYLRPGGTDMRSGALNLAILVEYEMKLKPFSKAVFIFCSKNKRCIKAIVWNRNGWLLLSKRLDCKGCFKWPETNEEVKNVSIEQVVGMLRGNDVFREFQELNPTKVG